MVSLDEERTLQRSLFQDPLQYRLGERLALRDEMSPIGEQLLVEARTQLPALMQPLTVTLRARDDRRCGVVVAHKRHKTEGCIWFRRNSIVF